MSEDNPYQATAISRAVDVDDVQEERPFVWWRSILVWMIVCWISAAPSFFIALSVVNVQSWPALVAGVMTFVVAYIGADYQSSTWRFRQRKPVRYALITTYVIRILMSVIFPIALFVDLWCGIVSSVVLYPMGFDGTKTDLSPGAVYLWTVAQGLVLNMVLGLVWLIMFWLFAWSMGPDPLRKD